MNRNEIRNKIIEIVDKYGTIILKKCDPVEVFNGLYSIFLIGGEYCYYKQQLAGILLYEVSPKLNINLIEVIKNCLDTWDVSVAEEIEKVKLMKLNSNEIKRLNPMEWWLGLTKNG